MDQGFPDSTQEGKTFCWSTWTSWDRDSPIRRCARFFFSDSKFKQKSAWKKSKHQISNHLQYDKMGWALQISLNWWISFETWVYHGPIRKRNSETNHNGWWISPKGPSKPSGCMQLAGELLGGGQNAVFLKMVIGNLRLPLSKAPPPTPHEIYIYGLTFSGW